MRQYWRNVADRRGEQDYFPAKVFSAAAKWLSQNEDAENFFLLADCFDPHEPWDPSVHYRKMYDPDDDVADVIWALYGHDRGYTERELQRVRANDAGEVTLVDRWFGEFYKAFLASDRTKDTPLIFTTDHGHYIGDQGITGKMGYPLLREVCDVPILVRHPQALMAGKSTDAFVSHTDIAATVLDACDVKPASAIDGQSLLPLFSGGQPPRRSFTLRGCGLFVRICTAARGTIPLSADTTRGSMTSCPTLSANATSHLGGRMWSAKCTASL